MMRAPSTVAFIDHSVIKPEVLLDGLKGAPFAFTLSASGDPLPEIASRLAGMRDIERLVLVAHGEPGAIELSGRKIDGAALARHAGSLAEIKAALATDAEVLLLSCADGAEPAGLAFITTLENALGVAVHAGTAELGGAAGCDAPSIAPGFLDRRATATECNGPEFAEQSIRMHHPVDHHSGTEFPREILFVDSNVADADILTGSLSPTIAVAHLSHDTDPLSQIASFLADKREVEQIHILAHGEPGFLHLGGTRVGVHHLAANHRANKIIRQALAPESVISLHACAVAQGTMGEAFVSALSETTNARVEASAGPLGGDAGWEAWPGAVLPYSAHALEAYPFRLSTFDFSSATITGSGTGTFTQTIDSVKVTVTLGNGGNLTTQTGTDGAAVKMSTAADTTMSFAFDSAVDITSLQVIEFGQPVNSGGNYIINPSTGTQITAVENGTELGADSQETFSTSGWNGVTSFTISYSGGGNILLGVDTIQFTAATSDAAATTDAGFNTTDGTNLNPSNVTFGTGDQTLTIAQASHITSTSVATDGGGTGDTLVLTNGGDLTTSGFTLSGFEILTLGDNASATMSETQHDGFNAINGGSGTESITLGSVNGDGNVTGDADIETYVLGASGFTLTLGAAAQNVTGSSGADTVNVGTLTATGTLSGGAGTDILQLGDGANISGATVSGFETLTLSGGASVTMTEAQHDAFSSVTAPGSDVITISAAENGFQTNSAVEKYILGVANATTITGGAQEITGSGGNDTFTFQGLTYTGTLSGGAGTDAIQMTSGTDISGATVTGVENLTMAGSASVTMSVSQLSAFSGGTITANGSETVTLSGDGNLSTVTAIESYVLNDDSTNARTVTLTNAGHSVSATSSTDAVTFDAGGLTLTGTLTGEGTVNDTLSISNGANVSGATISGIANLTLANDGSATMTAAQLNGFSGTTTATGTNTLTLTSTGSVTGADLSAIETLATASGGSETITLTAAQAAGKTLTATDTGNDSFVVTGSTGNQAITGSAGADTIDGGSGSDTIQGGSGSDVISGGDGADSLASGSGQDSLIGGAGNDTFVGTASDFNGDVISGAAAGDVIVLSGDTSFATNLNGTSLGSSISVDGGTLSFSGAASGLTITGTTSGGNSVLTLTAPASNSGGGGSSGGGSSSGGASGPVTVVDDDNDTMTGGARTISNNGSEAGSAAIVQNTGNNGNIVTATLPPSVSITSSGPAAAQSTQDALTTLVNSIDERDSTGESGLISGAQSFLNRLASTTTLDVRTIIPSTTENTLGDPIVITGTSSGTQSEAFVIDLRSMPSGSTLQLDNIEFASIIGDATVSGGAGQNYVTGDDARQFISLGAEDDTLSGGAGEDTVGSSWGEDILYGNQGTDLVFGGGGMDTVYGGQDADTVRGDNDNDWVYGNKGDDTLSGGNGEDLLFGGQNDDIVYGNAGDDSISGNLGSDSLYGGQGNDLISGGDGADILAGNKGDDTLSGGEGADIFVFEFDGGNDQLADFRAGTDTLALESGLAVAGGTESDGNTTVTFSDGGTVTVIGVGKTDLAAATGWDLG